MCGGGHALPAERLELGLGHAGGPHRAEHPADDREAVAGYPPRRTRTCGYFGVIQQPRILKSPGPQLARTAGAISHDGAGGASRPALPLDVGRSLFGILADLEITTGVNPRALNFEQFALWSAHAP
jgi:hypothetical protein